MQRESELVDRGGRFYQKVKAINDWEPQLLALSDEDLNLKTCDFRTRLKEGKSLDDLLPEAFAVVREASRRVLGLRHYDVQLVRKCRTANYYCVNAAVQSRAQC